mgnify:FL=1
MSEKNSVVADRSGFITEKGNGIYWEYFGKGDKEVVVLLNGLAMHTPSWYSMLQQFNSEFDVLLFDYQGQGKSNCDDKPYFISDFADYLALIMDTNKIDKVHVMGVSYGGFVAADFGRLHQDRLHTLTLSGILLSREVTFQMYQDISLRFYTSGPEIFELYTQYLYEKIFGENFLRVVYDKLGKMRQDFYERYKNQIHCLIRLTEAQNPFFERIDNHIEEYQAIKTPTLILAGKHDRAIPLWMQEKICDIIPDTRLVVIDNCGHLTYLEQPKEFWQNLIAFIKSKSTSYQLS